MRLPVLDITRHDALGSIPPRIDRAMTDDLMRTLALDAAGASALRIADRRRDRATLPGPARHHRIDPQDFLPEPHPCPSGTRGPAATSG